MSGALRKRIARLIAAQGPISIAEYMTIALLDPQLGYYRVADPLGAGGDFITAPEISQMFGELIGAWLADAWLKQGRPAQPLLVELGPGRGTLMADVLRVIKQAVPDLFEQAEINLVEVSSPLWESQAEKLTPIQKRVRWRNGIEELPHDRPLFLVANEFFDALAVRQYVRTERGWCERMVGADASGALVFVLSPVVLPAANVPADRDGAPMGGVFETSPLGEALAEEIGFRIARNGGAALIVDYGYDTPGFGETLQAVKRHRFADVLREPGSADISTHVDFPALARAAGRGGAAAFGPVGQGAFLTALGIVQRADRLNDTAGLARLTDPEQMGTLFKALAIMPKTAAAPAGF